MKKLLETLKANRTAIIIAIVLLALIGCAVAINLTQGAAPTSQVVAKSEREIKLEELLEAMTGVGKSEVMINEEKGDVKGVVIVCEGANNISVKNSVLNAASTALNVDRKIIAVYAMNNK